MKRIVFLGVIAGSLLMASCSKRIYWGDMQPNTLYPISRQVEMRIQPGDRLRILVSSQNPELSAPFNMGTGGYQVNMDGTVRTSNTGMEPGYMVDNEGRIDFPVLGMMRVEGLTLLELSIQIKEALRQGRHITNALVTVTFLNLKVTVIGEVGSPGTLSVQEDRLTLLDAIVKSGDFTRNASLSKVLVVREEAGGRRMMINDMRTVRVFNSPSFYLQQNDIVYVLPRVAQKTPGEERTLLIVQMLLGLGSTIVSTLLLMKFRNL